MGMGVFSPQTSHSPTVGEPTSPNPTTPRPRQEGRRVTPQTPTLLDGDVHALQISPYVSACVTLACTAAEPTSPFNKQSPPLIPSTCSLLVLPSTQPQQAHWAEAPGAAENSGQCLPAPSCARGLVSSGLQ